MPITICTPTVRIPFISSCGECVEYYGSCVECSEDYEVATGYYPEMYA